MNTIRYFPQNYNLSTEFYFYAHCTISSNMEAFATSIHYIVLNRPEMESILIIRQTT